MREAPAQHPPRPPLRLRICRRSDLRLCRGYVGGSYLWAARSLFGLKSVRPQWLSRVGWPAANALQNQATGPAGYFPCLLSSAAIAVLNCDGSSLFLSAAFTSLAVRASSSLFIFSDQSNVRSS